MKQFVMLRLIASACLLLVLSSCTRAERESDLSSIFAAHGVKKVSRALHDWGKLTKSVASFHEVRPASIEETQAIIKTAYQHGVRVRVRGGGHSMNGSSLPRKGELLLRTEKLRAFRFEDEDTITVGPAPSMYELREFLGNHGYLLPVYNDGALGPSVGGYLSAGGIGPGSAVYGGFWENVRAFTFIDGTGALRTAQRGDEVFPWFFGGMGQLGVIVEVKLEIIPQGKSALPRRGVIPDYATTHPAEAREFAQRYQDYRVYWYTLFVPPDAKDDALRELKRIVDSHPGIRYLPPYVYPMKYRTFNPQLIYPSPKDFVAIGLWGQTRDTPDVPAVLREIEREVNALSRRPGYRRYIQSETNLRATDLRDYFGDTVFTEFVNLKRRLDPKMLLNPGVFRETE